MSEICLDFEDLLVNIKKQYLDKKAEISAQLWDAANSAYTKMTKYYTKINSESYAIATVLDPRYKLTVYDTTQDPIALKERAQVAITSSFDRYSHEYTSLNDSHQVQTVADPQPIFKRRRMLVKKPEQNELTTYLLEPEIGEDLDPLNYWRVNKHRFPVLARMARDYLALQPTFKDVEGSFSKESRTIPYYGGSQTVESIRSQMMVNSGYYVGIFQ